MRAVIGLLLLFAGAWLIWIILRSSAPTGGTGGGPDEQPAPALSRSYQAGSMSSWGTVQVRGRA